MTSPDSTTTTAQQRPVFTPADAAELCALVRSTGGDPDLWSRPLRAAVTRLHGYRDGRVGATRPEPDDATVERVARALTLCAVSGEYEAVGRNWRQFVPDAKAALAALTEAPDAR